ncbi:hypothetical protein V8C86DRAFT_2736025 [Haematococcus lacustris]
MAVQAWPLRLAQPSVWPAAAAAPAPQLLRWWGLLSSGPSPLLLPWGYLLVLVLVLVLLLVYRVGWLQLPHSLRVIAVTLRSMRGRMWRGRGASA